MRIEPKPDTVRNPAAQFTGDVYLDMIATPQSDAQQAVVAKVRFLPGARTAWHSHANGQALHVTEGVAWMGTRDGAVEEVLPGRTVYIPAGEEHWHGATPTSYMEHLAITENADDPATTTTWLEHVADADYHRP
ncbi:cupin domain-containing protein [Rathayibacter sp. VKM Ac-2803]|uniref:(R)-mandelonitrile lyase n=1 Tax=Rathayibacter sp. VKM Ac-2803 TaxID=2609256 RepID=UPI00135903BC|nr:cupin domain-containing protein [Rathayibacter sp. VKM Ac-2803]MWV48851.1 cupin domain-containing protein [Rathayibacter sp. VKM Ac-2803]